MDTADEAVLCQELLVGLRAIGRIRPNAARRVGLVEQPLAQAAALVGGGIGRAPFADEAETAIDRDIVLISGDRNRQINRWKFF